MAIRRISTSYYDFIGFERRIVSDTEFRFLLKMPQFMAHLTGGQSLWLPMDGRRETWR